VKIFLAHNFYQQAGGEDRSFAAEASLLETYGHEVIRHTAHNHAIEDMSSWSLAQTTLWSRKSYEAVASLMRIHRPDVAHFNNTFPLLSPSVYYAAQSHGVPVVQSLRNFRLFCSNGFFFRDGQVCTDCLRSGGAIHGVIHKCYRDHRLHTLGVAALQTAHRWIGTWTNQVDRYIALTPSARRTFIEAGLPAHKIDVKPNFLTPTPPVGEGKGNYAVFVGRLSEEKGIHVMLRAWASLDLSWRLMIIGDGPLLDDVREAATNKAIDVTGWLDPDEVQQRIGQAKLLLFPSTWYETFGRVAIEAFASGTPVIASDHGAMRDLVDHGRTGRLFRPGSASALAREIQWAADHPAQWARMRKRARAEFEAKYAAPQNYERLMEIYSRTIDTRSRPEKAHP